MPVLDRFRLDGRVALITAGAGPLIGSSCTEALAEAGATVITASRSPERNRDYAEKLRSRGFNAHGFSFDLSRPESIHALCRQISERFGAPDILVNCALSRSDGAGTLEEVTAESLAGHAQADMVGLLLVCQAFCPAMAERGRGSVINIASMYGLVANDLTLYAGTRMQPPIAYPFLKGGLISLTRALAAQYGKRGVRVNALSPGGYLPDPPEPFHARYRERCPLGRMMTHEDIQGAIVFLASDAGRYVTGANVVVDGGWTAI